MPHHKPEQEAGEASSFGKEKNGRGPNDGRDIGGWGNCSVPGVLSAGRLPVM